MLRSKCVKRLEKKHPLAIRWFHWINFPVLMVMIWSGLLIYWANDVYRIGFGDLTLVKFFPDWFYHPGAKEAVPGSGLYRLVQLAWLVALCGGYPTARFIHFWLTIGYCAFFVVHVGQVVKTGWNNFRAMVTGYEVVIDPDPAPPAPPPQAAEPVAVVAAS